MASNVPCHLLFFVMTFFKNSLWLDLLIRMRFFSLVDFNANVINFDRFHSNLINTLVECSYKLGNERPNKEVKQKSILLSEELKEKPIEVGVKD